jgi:hypothetical protein
MKKKVLLDWIEEESVRLEKQIARLAANSIVRLIRKGTRLESKDFSPGLSAPRTIRCTVTLLSDKGISLFENNDQNSGEHYFIPWKQFLRECTWKLI